MLRILLFFSGSCSETEVSEQLYYIKIFPDYSFQVMRKEQIKFVYDPSHPDAVYSKDGLRGYIKYPDINIEQEYNDISEIVKILTVLESTNR